MKHWLLIFILLVFPAHAEELQRLDIARNDGTSVVFRVEVASTPKAMAKGLMYRTRMAADRGMLFDFGSERPVSMWMKNTYLPLDMLFIKEDGTIHHIAEHTAPETETEIPSRGDVRYVLELNAGTAEQARIRVGAKVSGLTY